MKNTHLIISQSFIRLFKLLFFSILSLKEQRPLEHSTMYFKSTKCVLTGGKLKCCNAKDFENDHLQEICHLVRNRRVNEVSIHFHIAKRCKNRGLAARLTLTKRLGIYDVILTEKYVFIDLIRRMHQNEILYHNVQNHF